MPRGRPDTYLKMTESEREELKRKIENLGAKGYSEVAIAHEIGVPRGTLQGWEKRHADISAALSRARQGSAVVVGSPGTGRKRRPPTGSDQPSGLENHDGHKV